MLQTKIFCLAKAENDNPKRFAKSRPGTGCAAFRCSDRSIVGLVDRLHLHVAGAGGSLKGSPSQPNPGGMLTAHHCDPKLPESNRTGTWVGFVLKRAICWTLWDQWVSEMGLIRYILFCGWKWWPRFHCCLVGTGNNPFRWSQGYC